MRTQVQVIRFDMRKQTTLVVWLCSCAHPHQRHDHCQWAPPDSGNAVHHGPMHQPLIRWWNGLPSPQYGWYEAAGHVLTRYRRLPMKAAGPQHHHLPNCIWRWATGLPCGCYIHTTSHPWQTLWRPCSALDPHNYQLEFDPEANVKSKNPNLNRGSQSHGEWDKQLIV